jgi:hypothetical protein
MSMFRVRDIQTLRRLDVETFRSLDFEKISRMIITPQIL